MRIINVPELEKLAQAGPTQIPWSDEEIAIIETYYPRGVSVPNLAKHLSDKGTKRSVSAVEHIIRRKGLQRGR